MTTTTTSPVRAEGLELLGAPGGSGYREAQQLVRRPDGQTLQLTPLLYALLELLDQPKDAVQLAQELSARLGRTASVDDVQHLLDKLEPLGVLAGSDPQDAVRSNPLLALRFKVVASNPATTRRLTAPFAALFAPYILWPVLAAFVAVCWFVLVDKGLASATRQAFDTPGLLLGVFALTVLSAGFHELGHAAACRYGGATPGAMGMGLYLVWPAFYTNVDDSYRLDRKGRLRVDLGGLYFNALVAVAVTAVWLVTGVDALLLGVATQLLQMLRQLAPMLRADGYHILSDLTGVPDLFAHMRPTLRGLLPRHWGEPSPLTRKARVLVTTWVLVMVPILVSMMLTAVLLLPRLIATAWASGQVRGRQTVHAAEQADLLSVAAGLLQLLALALPVLGVSYLVLRMVRGGSTTMWRRTDGRPFLRGVLSGLVAVLLIALVWTWWPTGQYQPVRSDERGTLTSLVSASRPQPVSLRRTGLAMVPRGGVSQTHPALLLVREEKGVRALVLDRDGSVARSFPFALPSAPRPGDNQSLAVNDKDGSTVYDVSVALVTITDGRPADRANSAYALASCTDCITVSVAFQVVLVVGQSNVVTPVNTSVAANKSCLRCSTTALAVQLVATLTEAPDAQVRSQIEQALRRLKDARGEDPATMYAEMRRTQREITTLLTAAGGTTVTTAEATASASPSTDPSASASPSDSASPEASAAPTEIGSASPEPSPSDSASPEPTPSDSAAPATDPSPSAAPTP